MAVVGSAGVTTDDQTNAAERRAGGEFVRGVSSARSFIGSEEFPAESDRYHLYIAFNCPWCHRVALVRAVLGLEDAISMDVCFPGRTTSADERGENLWRFAPEGATGQNGRHVTFPECTTDTVGGKKYIVDIYAESGLEQKSIPILYDKVSRKVVNNESAEIMRMFETVMLPYAKRPLELYPPSLQQEVEDTNTWLYTDINNGAYKAGFSSNQDVYEAAFAAYFAALERLNGLLEGKSFILGDAVTECDLRAFTTLWRHDPVYHNRMKLNQAFLFEYAGVWKWMGRMMALPGIESVVHEGILAHAKQGYFGRTGNGTIPIGPKGYPQCYGKARP
ncbi:yqjG [Symbiodinium sp. CCMP2456]|nr:yqjG [Symbiodinium sp. CCMP2456]